MASSSRLVDEVFETRAYEFDGKFNLFIVQYKIYKVEADGVVLYNDAALSNSSATTSRVVQVAGEEFVRSCQANARPPGYAVNTTRAGNLKCGIVIHAICPFLMDNHRTEVHIETGVDQAYLVYEKVLAEARHHDMETIAIEIPDLEGHNKLIAPQALLKCCLAQSIRRCQQLKLIVLVSQSVEVLRAMTALLGQGMLPFEHRTVEICELDESMTASLMRDRMVLPDVYRAVSDAEDDDDELDYEKVLDDDEYLHFDPDKKPTKKKSPSFKTFKNKIKKPFAKKERKQSLKTPSPIPSPEVVQDVQRYTTTPVTKREPPPVPVALWNDITFDMNENIVVHVQEEHPVSIKADALVNDTDLDLQHTSTSSKNIDEVAGPDFRTSCIEYRKKYGTMEADAIMVASGGNLPSITVLNLCSARTKPGPFTEEDLEYLQEMNCKLLQTAISEGIESICLQPIGYDYGYPADMMALALFRALVDHAWTPSTITKVTVSTRICRAVLTSFCGLMCQGNVRTSQGVPVTIQRLPTAMD